LAQLGSRIEFPELQDKAYLAHAGISPLSTPVVNAITGLAQSLARQGAGAIGPILEMRQNLRQKLGQLLHCSPQDLALTPGTSWGVLAIAQNFPWRSQDRIVLFRGEFPTNVTPWQQAAQQHSLQLSYLEAEDFRQSKGLELLERELQKGVRLLAVSAVQFQSGLRMPLEDIVQLCRSYGCQVFVDAIQACGVVPIAPQHLGIDYLAGGAHKWLMASEGCGFLYVAPERQSDLRRHWSAWLSHQDPIRFLFEGPGELRYDRPLREEIQALELGSSSAFSQVALEASLTLLLELGIDKIFEHVQHYLDALEPALVAMGFTSRRSRQARSGILALELPQGVKAAPLAAQLREHGIHVSTPDGLLRIAPHWPNCPQREIGGVLEAFSRVLKSYRKTQ